MQQKRHTRAGMCHKCLTLQPALVSQVSHASRVALASLASGAAVAACQASASLR